MMQPSRTSFFNNISPACVSPPSHALTSVSCSLYYYPIIPVYTWACMREVHTSIKHIHEQHAFSITDAMALLLVYRVMQGRLYIILCMSIIIYIIRGYILYYMKYIKIYLELLIAVCTYTYNLHHAKSSLTTYYINTHVTCSYKICSCPQLSIL